MKTERIRSHLTLVIMVCVWTLGWMTVSMAGNSDNTGLPMQNTDSTTNTGLPMDNTAGTSNTGLPMNNTGESHAVPLDSFDPELDGDVPPPSLPELRADLRELHRRNLELTDRALKISADSNFYNRDPAGWQRAYDAAQRENQRVCEEIISKTQQADALLARERGRPHAQGCDIVAPPAETVRPQIDDDYVHPQVDDMFVHEATDLSREAGAATVEREPIRDTGERPSPEPSCPTPEPPHPGGPSDEPW